MGLKSCNQLEPKVTAKVCLLCVTSGRLKLKHSNRYGLRQRKASDCIGISDKLQKIKYQCMTMIKTKCMMGVSRPTHRGCIWACGTPCAVGSHAWCTGGPPATAGCRVTPAAYGPAQNRWGSRRPGSPGEQCATPRPRSRPHPQRSSEHCWCTGSGLWRRSIPWRQRCTLGKREESKETCVSTLIVLPGNTLSSSLSGIVSWNDGRLTVYRDSLN